MQVAEARQIIADLLPQYVARRSQYVKSLADWAVSTPVVLDGRPFTFDKHEYLIEPYNDNHPHQVELKATQLGLTTRALLRALYAARYRNFKGILYLFPSKTDVLDFSKSRVTPMIEENPDTIGSWVKDTDAAGIKQISNTFLYLRGMVSRVGLKSAPADMVIFDELDEAPQNAVDMALERMGHSEFKEIHKLSNPTLPDYGIDKAFQGSDQRYWLLRCEGCGHYNCLEDVFLQAKPPETPNCYAVRPDGQVDLVCEKCQHVLNPSIGEWVAKKPSVQDCRGYHYSQLFSHYVNPREILEKFRTTNNLQDFYNLKIGVAYVESENRLSIEEVLHLCTNRGIESADNGPCSMGVDQGKDLHVVIGKRGLDGLDSILHIGVYRDWEDLDRLMNNFNVKCCVVDALPETRNARTFANRFLGKVFLNYYQEKKKGGAVWRDEAKDETVSVNRTESLDESHNQIMKRKLYLPKQCEVVKTFAEHLHNVAKKLEEDEETGSKRYVYLRLGPDHFRHALNYECMARTRIGMEQKGPKITPPQLKGAQSWM